MVAKVAVAAVMGVYTILFVYLALGGGNDEMRKFVRRHRLFINIVAGGMVLGELLAILSLAFSK